MIGMSVTGEDGKPLPQYTKLSKSAYQPGPDIMKLFSEDQSDYQLCWRLQHRPFDEFDGFSVLQRAKKDQETFGVFVGAEWVPENRRWRWKGRKNTARNKLISILSQMIAGMLYPLVSAQDEESEPDKLTARVMRILVEDHLKKANYEMKFMYMVLSALVNPAVIVEVAYYEAMQRIKEQLDNGQIKVTEAVDQFLSGLNLNIIPVDQFLVSDFYTSDVQKQPIVVRVNRIPWDTARKIYGSHEDFKYVQAGKTRVFLAGQEHLTLYDVEWTEGDRYSVQEITIYRRDEDLETVWVGGVFMGNKENVYNSNRFKHRRLSLIGDEWKSIPILPFAKSYYEPIDPTGRFFYGKSGAFKEYWDDNSINHAYRLLQDGMTLEVFKPLFLSGVAKVDGIVIAPGVTIGMPQGANVAPWSMSPNLTAAMEVLGKNEADIGNSTQTTPVPGQPVPGVPATQTIQAANQAMRQLGVFGLLTADLIKQVGELTIDCIIQHTLPGELDASVPEALILKYKTALIKTKDKGKEMTNKIVFKSELIGRKMSQKQVEDYEWKLWKDKGSDDMVIYHCNPYKMARMMYSMHVDADAIVNHATGNDRQAKILKYQMLTQQFVYPFTDQKQVADDVIEEFSEGDPDRLKAKQDNSAMMGGMGMQGGQGGGQPTPPIPSPMQPGAAGGGIGTLQIGK